MTTTKTKANLKRADHVSIGEKVLVMGQWAVVHGTTNSCGWVVLSLEDGHLMLRRECDAMVEVKVEAAPKPQPMALVLVDGEDLQVGTHVWFDGMHQRVTLAPYRTGDLFVLRFDGYGEFAFGCRSGRQFSVVVEEGTPATFGIGGDCYAQKVDAVRRVCKRTQRPLEVVVSGVTWTWRDASARYAIKGQPHGGSGYLRLGVAVDRRDPSF